MATQVDIYNLALSRVRAGSVGSTTESSPQAIQCNILYEQARDHLLTLYPWRFAKTTRALSLTGTTPDEWLYAYDYPNDCLRLHYILPANSGKNLISSAGISTPSIEYTQIPYEVATGSNGSRLILTDYEDAKISYTQAVTDTRLFDPLFVQALAWLMATDLAIALGGDSGKAYRSAAEQQFRDIMQQAVALSENEAEDGRPKLPRAIQARTGGLSSDYFYGDLLYRRY